MADSEDIYSKLAVEPVLRTYVLSLIAAGFVKSREEIISFFSKTFWAHQYKDMHKLETIIDRMLQLLQDWEFIMGSAKKGATDVKDDFVAADELAEIGETANYRATALGKRVAELYLDPYTAHTLITAMHKSREKEKIVLYAVLHMVSNTLEMQPLLRVKSKEYDMIQSTLASYEDDLFFVEPSAYDLDYDDFLNSVKTALFMQEWCDEMDEEYLLEKYAIRPGEVKAKLDIGDWLLYSCIELSKILSLNELHKELHKVRTRLSYGVKEELIALLKLKGVGRVRARKLFNAGFKTTGDLKKADITSLVQLVGKAQGVKIKEELGQEVTEVPKGKRVGQLSLGKY